MVTTHHLIKLLDEAASKNEILQEIIIVPYANPIGLSQGFMDRHLGRFSFETVINFNRSWYDLSSKIESIVGPKLSKTDPLANVQIIREAMVNALNTTTALREEEVMKRELFKLACVADIVLDLHCDCVALMHMYTHDKCWPAFTDLAVELQSYAQLLAPCSGGNPFDEACSAVWAVLAAKFPEYPIPMGCQSATVELRGTLDVSCLSVEHVGIVFVQCSNMYRYRMSLV
jgi:predicted deacylase